MSDMSSITYELASYESDDDDEHHVVPPPPPHIELLRVAKCAQSGRCITRVLSYLDDHSRRAASCSCVYLKDAVNECNNMDRETDAPLAKSERESRQGLVAKATPAAVEPEGEPMPLDPDEVADETKAESPRRVAEFPSPVDPPAEDGVAMMLPKVPTLVPDVTPSTVAAVVEDIAVETKTREDTEVLEIKRLLAAEVEANEKRTKQTEIEHAQETVAVLEHATAKECNEVEPKEATILKRPDPPSPNEEEKLDPPSFSEEEKSDAAPVDVEEKVEEQDEREEADDEEEEELKSISTMKMKSQSDKFIARVGQSGTSTPVSFVTKTEDEEDTVMTMKPKDLDDMQTEPTRLVLGSASHLGDGSEVQIQVQDDSNTTIASTTNEVGHKVSCSNSTGEMYQVSLGTTSSLDCSSLGDDTNAGLMPTVSRVDENDDRSPKTVIESSEQQPHQPEPQPQKYTTLRELSNPNEVTPFDEEIPFVSRAVSSLSVDEDSLGSDAIQIDASKEPGQVGGDDSYEDSIVSSDCSETTTLDVLAQFSDAALFGGTPKIVTDLMTDIKDSAKEAVSNLYHTGRRNECDDDGPIKIGDKYYTHYEAVRLWKKAKVKLEDQYYDVDEVGNVKLEQATFFEKNSVFQEKPPEEDEEQANDDLARSVEKKFKSRAEVRKEQGAAPINELVSGYNLFKGRSNKVVSRFDESIVLSGGQEEAGKLPFMSPVEERFEADNETAETESVTMSDGSTDVDRLTSDSETSGDASNTERVPKAMPVAGSNQVPIDSKDNNSVREADSIAGSKGSIPSIPSHMGSMYGVEVTSLRGTNCNFINGKSTEPIRIGGCEQSVSVLGSQYGTEVLFKRQKFTRARKPRTLASHNMRVKSTTGKQNSSIKALKQGNQKKAQLPLKKLKLGIKKKA